MKKSIVKIGKLLLDVLIFAVSAALIAILGSILCSFIAIICILIPVLAIYYAIADDMTLKDSLVEQLEFLIDGLVQIFQPKTESD